MGTFKTFSFQFWKDQSHPPILAQENFGGLWLARNGLRRTWLLGIFFDFLDSG